MNLEMGRTNKNCLSSKGKRYVAQALTRVRSGVSSVDVPFTKQRRQDSLIWRVASAIPPACVHLEEPRYPNPRPPQARRKKRQIISPMAHLFTIVRLPLQPLSGQFLW